jgi:hypothetical protein
LKKPEIQVVVKLKMGLEKTEKTVRFGGHMTNRKPDNRMRIERVFYRSKGVIIRKGDIDS